jgi:hypothetical protein
VTSLSFACYLVGRFVVGPMLVGHERSKGPFSNGASATAE